MKIAIKTEFIPPVTSVVHPIRGFDYSEWPRSMAVRGHSKVDKVERAKAS